VLELSRSAMIGISFSDGTDPDISGGSEQLSRPL